MLRKLIFLGAIFLLVIQVGLLHVGEHWKMVACGISALFMILAYYGESILAEIERLTKEGD